MDPGPLPGSVLSEERTSARKGSFAGRDLLRGRDLSQEGISSGEGIFRRKGSFAGRDLSQEGISSGEGISRRRKPLSPKPASLLEKTPLPVVPSVTCRRRRKVTPRVTSFRLRSARTNERAPRPQV